MRKEGEVLNGGWSEEQSKPPFLRTFKLASPRYQRQPRTMTHFVHQVHALATIYARI